MTGKPPLSETHPELAKQAVDWDPTSLVSNSSLEKRWRCIFGHEWEDSISHRKNGRGCPICAGKRVLAGFNDLASKNPRLAAEAAGWDPSTVTVSSNQKKLWRCEMGHEWNATVNSRHQGNNCPFCSGNRVLVGFNDLAFRNPLLASQAVGWDPTTVTVGSTAKKLWRCESEHEWEATVANRSYGYGCPVCSGRMVWAGLNDLASKNPTLASQAVGWDPTEFTEYSHTKKRWRCNLGHEFEATVANRNRGAGCSVCSGKKVLTGFNDLATKNPSLASQAIGWDPRTVTEYSHTKRLWRCDSGHEWEAYVSDRSMGTSCPICSGNQVLRGFNDLASKNPFLASQAAGWDPSTVTVSSNQKRRWRCEFGHEWNANVSDRTSGNGCPSCSPSGFDPNSDGWLYLLNHEQWQMLQIGITNFPKERLKRHKKLGWEVIEVRGPMDGLNARAWESSILKMLSRNGATIASEDVAGKFDGYTEAWTLDTFPIASLKELMERVRNEEE